MYIDYVGLLPEAEGEQRHLALGAVTRKLKLLARSCGIAVIAAVQRDVETGRIRYAREMAEHADIVLGWDSPEEERTNPTRMITVQVEKGRNIPRFTFDLLAEFSTMRMTDATEKPAIILNAADDTNRKTGDLSDSDVTI